MLWDIWKYLKSCHYDHIFLAINDFYIAFISDDANISRLKEAIGRHAMTCFFWLIPITRHDLWTLNTNLPRGAVRQLNFIIIYVLVYLNQREVAAHREVVELQGDLKDLAVVEERNRLAREIHDGLGASLSSLIIQTEYVTQLAKDEAVLTELRELKTSAEESIEELRRSLRMMREDFDLAHGLEEYVRTFGDRTQLSVSFTRSGVEPGHMAPESALTLFRVLQECLSNAVKHAQARHVQVTLAFLEATVMLGVKDDGKGFDPQVKRPGHYGLINMQERANKVGGAVAIESTPGAGAQVTFSVPIEPVLLA